MSVSTLSAGVPLSGVTPMTPGNVPTPEEAIALIAARPAALHLQEVALAATGRGTSGQGTPAVEEGKGTQLDTYA